MIDKVANSAAASALAGIGKIAGIDDGKTAAGGASFGDMMKTAITNSIGTMKASETMSAKAVTGEANLPDVVASVNAAQLTLDTVVAVRDRMINAYQDMMRMPI